MPVILRSALVEHAAARMFALVNDVAAYPRRFDWCREAQVLEQGDWSKESISAGFKQVLKTHGIKMPQLAMPVRVLAVGTAHTPSVDAVLALLGREKITERLQKR